ncbi:MAG: dihydrodipicolinate synthase family protein [Bryobacterales bacterium]|nr:dihydrodipicolinate synthase family protein [Bryobacterales bacterium]
MTDHDIVGIVPPMVTPFDAEGGFDEALHRAEVRRMLAAKVHGVAVCGSTGEGHVVTTDETRRITAATLEEAQGRIPVITGIICNSTQAAIERGRAVADLGVAALQVTPVHYLFRPDDDSMSRHFDQIAQATGLPVIIYNVVPWSYLSPKTLARILRDVDGVIGVKQSASDLKALADLLVLVDSPDLRRKGVRILSAVDAFLYPSFSLGAHGAIAAILTAVPGSCVNMWTAVREHDHRRARRLHESLLGLWNAIDHPNLPANVKAALRLQGRDGGFPRAPMPASSPEQEEEIRQALVAGAGDLE